jgi:hypothetical protein
MFTTGAAGATENNDHKTCFLGRCMGEKIEDFRGDVVMTEIKCEHENDFGFRHCKINNAKMNRVSKNGPDFIGSLYVKNAEYQFYNGKMCGFSLTTNSDSHGLLFEMSIGKWGEPNLKAWRSATWELTEGKLTISVDGAQSTLRFVTDSVTNAIQARIRRDGAELF